MAIYHFSAQVISRSQGRSSIAAAAYRSGAKMKDERTGLVHDFRKKAGVDYAEVMLPAAAPQDFANREVLWSEIERVEKRKDAQLAREINIALPVELSKSEQINLAKQFVQEQFVELGMCADLAVHDLASHNPHFHVMLTTRHVSEDGFGGKNRSWNDKKLLERWREAWANYANKALADANVEKKIDHRTLAAQGIDRAPTKHKGPSVSAIVARGDISYVAQAQSAEQAHEQQIIDAQNIDIAAINEELRTLSNAQAEAEAVLAKARQQAKEKLQQKREQQNVVSPATPPNPPPSGGNLAKPARERAVVIAELNAKIEKYEKRLKHIVQAGLPQHLLAKNKTLVQLKAAQASISKQIKKNVHDAREQTNKKLAAWRKKHKLLAFLRIKTPGYRRLLREIAEQDATYKRLASKYERNVETIENEVRIDTTMYANRLQAQVSKLKVQLSNELKAQAQEQKKQVEQRQKQLSKQRARSSSSAPAQRERRRL